MAFQFPLNPAVGQVYTPAPGLSFKWDGIGWAPFTAAEQAGFSAGTVMLFFNAAAPIGWVKDVTHNDKVIRIVNTGGGPSGGAYSFGAIFNSGRSTVGVGLSVAQLPGGVIGSFSVETSDDYPDHAHQEQSYPYSEGFGGGGGPAPKVHGFNGYYTGGANTRHRHGASGNVNSHGSGAGHGHPFEMAVQYVDAILCVKA